MPLTSNANMPGPKTPNTTLRPATPLVDQIVSAMQRDIDTRKLLPGTRVPSIRDLARRQLISRHSAVEAYNRLVGAGYLEPRAGSGFYVAARARSAPGLGAGDRRRIYDVAWLIRQALEDGGDMLKVGGPCLPDEWLDSEGIRRAVRALGREPGGHLLHYGHPLGYLPLRQQAVRANTWVQRHIFGTTPRYGQSSLGGLAADQALPFGQPQQDTHSTGVGRAGQAGSRVLVGRDGWLFLHQDFDMACTLPPPARQSCRAPALRCRSKPL